MNRQNLRWPGLVGVLYLTLGLGADAAQAQRAPDPGTDCTASETRLCLDGGRFQVDVEWRDFTGNTGVGHVVPFGSDDSGLLWFFNAANWEMLIKVLDGCGINEHFWVFSAATTNVEYTLRVTDTETGLSQEYFNPLGAPAQALTDVTAFDCEDDRRRRGGAGSAVGQLAAPTPLPAVPPRTIGGTCAPGQEAPCLNRGRFRVEVDWEDFQGNTGTGKVVPFSSDDSGLFWFFNADNWEMLVKVLDGCAINGRVWVFSAATTNVEYTLRVTDTQTGAERSYRNPLGRRAAAVTDVNAFTCSDDGSLPPDPGAAGDETVVGIDSDGDGLRDDVQRYIALTFPSAPSLQEALRQVAFSAQGATVDAASRPAALDHATDLMRAGECLAATRPGDHRELEAELMAQVLDTEARGRAFLDFQDQLVGDVFPMRSPAEWAVSCGSNPGLLRWGIGEPSDRTRATTCGGGGTTVVFGNGMLNDADEAMRSARILASRLRGLQDDRVDDFTFFLAYNPSRGFLADLWESVRQDIGTDFSRFYRILAGIEPMPDFFQDAYFDFARRLDRAEVASNPALAAHVDFYQRRILEAEKVVLVGHSQGNFFANQAHGSLTAEEQRSFGIVSVANPDSFVAGGHPYTTLLEDLVIGALPGALPANVANLSLADFPLRHNFVRAYLQPGSNSEGKILLDVLAVATALQAPDPEAGQGIITVTLTWGAQPDVDLHVFEPNGEHVFWQDRTGVSGFLDVDDVNGMGPEHYFVACDELETGRYRIGLNYFFGSQPETVDVEIQAGLVLRRFSLRLDQARGREGDFDPRPLADVVVTGSAEEGFDFVVQDRR